MPRSGAALVLVWMTEATVPAAHAELVEAAIKQMNHHPFLVLWLLSLMALAMGLPCPLLAQLPAGRACPLGSPRPWRCPRS